MCGMMKVAPFLAVWLLALPAVAEVDCNAGMEAIDASADFPLNAREFTKVVVPNERALVKTLGKTGYAADLKVETLNGDLADGAFHRTSVVEFDPGGARRETVVGDTVNTLARLKLSDKDIGLLADPASFALTPDNFGDRDIVYSGRQKSGERNFAVFDVLPRSQTNFGHAFAGRVWIRGRGTAIVKTCGRHADYPIAPMRYEITRAEIVDEKYVPVLARADEDVPIDGSPVHVRVTVTYSDYRTRP
jgi:hypothetical protein